MKEEWIDKELEANMDEVLKVVVMGRACRNTANIKNRQPIGQMFVKSSAQLPEFYQDIIKDELNVKKLTFTDDVRAFTSYTFKPQLKTVGPKYGKMLGGIKAGPGRGRRKRGHGRGKCHRSIKAGCKRTGDHSVQGGSSDRHSTDGGICGLRTTMASPLCWIQI